MPSSQSALQQALYAALSTDSALLGLLGAPRIHDVVPEPPQFPYVSFGHSLVRDSDASASAADEHVVTLHVWSRGPGRRETQSIIHAVRSALHDRALTLSGHRLVNLRHEFSETRRDADGETLHGLVRLRALTEPLAP